MYQHGTLVARKIGRCDCTPCRDAGNRYNARRELLINTGRWQPYTDAQPVRDHVNQLRAAGLGWQRIADLANVAHPTVSRLLYGQPSEGDAPTKRMRPRIAAALLAVHADLDTLADGAQIDATGTRRRSQALTCLGWSQSEQAGRLGVNKGNYTRINTAELVTAGRARAVRALYAELSMTVAPPSQSATYARRIAKRRKYAPPLAWDDDAIDDPAARPDFGEKVPSGIAVLENVDELVAQGYTVDQAAHRLGVSRSCIDKARRRARDKAVAA
jgi:transcriptional regulator with XRE-family HTH domain